MIRFFIPSILLLLVPAIAPAQVNQTADASIEVVGGLSVAKLTDLDFGTVFPQSGMNVTVSVDPSTDPNAASFEVISYNGALIFLNWTVDQPGPGLLFTPEVTSHTSIASLSGPLPNGGSFTVTQDNNHFIWVGGILEVQPTVLPGTYSGVITISVTY
jgi:spore coat protein U-like protein